MFSCSTASLLALILAAAAPSLADDNARSVSTLEFKNKFRESGIVPEVIAALDPAVSFYVTYKAADGHSELLVPGSSLTVGETAQPLEFSVENLQNATNITAQTRYLIYLLDADAPARSNPTARNLRYFLAGNYSAATANSTVLSTAQRLVIPAGQARPFTSFIQPTPTANSGVHRFIYALYTQPVRFSSAGFESVGMEEAIENWNLSRWRTQLGLGPAIGATFFTVDTGANNGQGTSNVPAAGSSAAGMGIPLAMAGVAALLGFMALA